MAINEHQYTNDLLKQRVLLISVMPTPYGGISIHAWRVEQKLIKQGCRVLVWDIDRQQLNIGVLGYYGKLIYFGLKARPQVIIYQTMQLRSWPLELLLLGLIGWLFDSKSIVVIHSARFIDRLRVASGYLTSLIFGLYSQIILVNQTLMQQINRKISLNWLQSKLKIESPFLPPNFNDSEILFARAPDSLKFFLNTHRPIISCAITRFELWQGFDLYGTDLILEAFSFLQKDWPQAGLVLMIGHSAGYLDLPKMPGIYYLYDYPAEVWPIIAKSNLFVRPTRSDSFGISVLEALSLGVPVVASDVCIRPASVTLFKSGSSQDLYLKMLDILARYFFRCS